MRLSRASLLVVLLVAGQLVALPGIAEGIERVLPGDNCAEDCPADTADGDCGTSCDECTCCARSMSAVLLAHPDAGTRGRFEIAWSPLATRVVLVLPEGVYHPPRA